MFRNCATALVVLFGIPLIFLTAAVLTPDTRGYGTHQQLGLPACVFLEATGWQCPHCGLTTSFCWFVRGNWIQSVRVNPAGFLLALTAAVVWGFQTVRSFCLRKVAFHRMLGRDSDALVLFAAISWMVISLSSWIARMLLE